MESKEIRALNNLFSAASWDKMGKTHKIYEEDRDVVKEVLKAFDIVRKKGINLFEIKFAFSLQEYNSCKGDDAKELTQEEFDTLRGVIKDECN